MSDYGLSVQQLDVINALSSGVSMSAAADEAGIHRNTIANWRRNSLPFQHALAGAQYDRALLFRERAEAAADLAFTALHEILADPKTPPSVRLKAALAVIQLATTPPPPKQQIELVLSSPSELHNSAQSTPAAPAPPKSASTPNNLHNCAQSAPTPDAQNLHNSAQQPVRRESPKVGRNDVCPCGSGLKYKRCCLDKPLHQSPLHESMDQSTAAAA